MKYNALFVRKDSAYKSRKHWDAWDAERDATGYNKMEACSVSSTMQVMG